MIEMAIDLGVFVNAMEMKERGVTLRKPAGGTLTIRTLEELPMDVEFKVLILLSANRKYTLACVHIYYNFTHV